MVLEAEGYANQRASRSSSPLSAALPLIFILPSAPTFLRPTAPSPPRTTYPVIHETSQFWYPYPSGPPCLQETPRPLA